MTIPGRVPRRMFTFLRRIFAQLLNSQPPLDPPLDPYAAVREPRRRSPGGRGSAVAVAEPGPSTSVDAVSRVAHRPGR